METEVQKYARQIASQIADAKEEGIKLGMSLNQGQLDRIESKLDLLLAKKKPAKQRSSSELYPRQFEIMWAKYPKRTGNNPKATAHASYAKRIKEGVPHIELENATVAYGMFCKATVEDNQYIMMGATFYGCKRPYAQDWTVPTQAETIPKSNDGIVDWAAQKGFRNPAPGESFAEYRRAVERLYQS